MLSAEYCQNYAIWTDEAYYIEPCDWSSRNQIKHGGLLTTWHAITWRHGPLLPSLNPSEPYVDKMWLLIVKWRRCGVAAERSLRPYSDQQLPINIWRYTNERNANYSYSHDQRLKYDQELREFFVLSNKKTELPQSDRAMRPIWCPEKFFESPWVHPRLLFLKFLTDFCSDRSYECATKFEVRSVTPLWDNRGTQKFGQSLDTSTPPFLQNFEWAFVRMEPLNVPAKFEIRSLTPSWDNNDYSFVWGCEPKSGKEEAVRGREWYRSKERWWLPIGSP